MKFKNNILSLIRLKKNLIDLKEMQTIYKKLKLV